MAKRFNLSDKAARRLIGEVRGYVGIVVKESVVSGSICGSSSSRSTWSRSLRKKETSTDKERSVHLNLLFWKFVYFFLFQVLKRNAFVSLLTPNVVYRVLILLFGVFYSCVCMWFSFAGDDSLGESGDGDEDDCG